MERVSASRLSEAYCAESGLRCEYPVDEISYLVCDGCKLRFFSPVVTGAEKFYAELQKISWYYSAGKQEFHIAARYVNAAHSVLEIGAGRGLFSRKIAAASYTGLEFSSAAIETASKDGIRLLPETIEHHAESNRDRYDVVCAFQVLEHVADPRSFLDAAASCLRRGGRLIISVPGEDSFARFAYWDVLNMPPHHVTRWTDECLRAIGPICNLQLTALIPEPLGRNMRRAYARATGDRWIADLLGMKLHLLDERLRRPVFASAAAVVSGVLRRWVAVTGRKRRRGHAVLAIFERTA